MQKNEEALHENPKVQGNVATEPILRESREETRGSCIAFEVGLKKGGLAKVGLVLLLH